MTVITKLAKRRMKLNMTQQQVADRAKVPYPTYQKLDSGTTNFNKNVQEFSHLWGGEMHCSHIINKMLTKWNIWIYTAEL